MTVARSAAAAAGGVAVDVSGVDVRFSIGAGRAVESGCRGNTPVVAVVEVSGSRLAAAAVSSAEGGVADGRTIAGNAASPLVPLARSAASGTASSCCAGSGTTGSGCDGAPASVARDDGS